MKDFATPRQPPHGLSDQSTPRQARSHARTLVCKGLGLDRSLATRLFQTRHPALRPATVSVWCGIAADKELLLLHRFDEESMVRYYSALSNGFSKRAKVKPGGGGETYSSMVRTP